MNRVKVLVFFVTVLMLGFYMVSCASKTHKKLTDAEFALRSAQEAGAENTSSYQEAEDLIARAKKLMESGQGDEAGSLLEEAKFKAIAAKGEAVSEQYMEGKTDAELQEEADFLGSQEFQSSSVLKDVFFDFDSASIKPDAKVTLDANAGYIIRNVNRLQLVVVEGYCDTRGTEEYNLALGQKRANSVKSYLVGLGVPPKMVQVISKGETEQWAVGISEYEYQQNRRAHFVTQ